MAFPTTGVSVTHAYVGASSTGGGSVQPVLRTGSWTEAPSTGTQSTNKAPDAGGKGESIFHVKVFGDSWFAIGPKPDPVNGPRFPLSASVGEYDFVANAGDFFAWVAA